MADPLPGDEPPPRLTRRLLNLVRRFSRDERGGSAVWPQDVRSAVVAAACIAAIVAAVVLGNVFA